MPILDEEQIEEIERGNHTPIIVSNPYPFSRGLDRIRSQNSLPENENNIQEQEF